MTTRTQLADPRTLRRAAAGRKMNRAEAQQLTSQIRATAHGLWRLVAEAYDRKAWQALGYQSWKDYATEELQMSESRSYQLVDTGRVMKAIGEVAGNEEVFESVVVTARETAKIKPHISTFKRDVQTFLKDGLEPSAAVEAAIANLPASTPRPTTRRQPDIVVDNADGSQTVIEVKEQRDLPDLEAQIAAKHVVPAPAARPVVASPFQPFTAAQGAILQDDDELEEALALLREVLDTVSARALGALKPRIEALLDA